MRNDQNWYNSLSEKAKSQNQSVEEVMRNDAVYLVYQQPESCFDDLKGYKLPTDRNESLLDFLDPHSFEGKIDRIIGSIKADENWLNNVKKKAEESKELERQLKEFSRYSVSDATTMALAELQAFKKTVEEQTGVITSLHNQLEEFKQTSQRQEQTIKQLETAKREAEKRIEQIEVEKNITEEKLAQKTKQVLFLQSVESLDVDRILQYHHDIGVHAGTIQNWIDRIAKKIIRNELSEQELSKFIDSISENSNLFKIPCNPSLFSIL